MPVDPEQRARLFNGDLDAVEAQARAKVGAATGHPRTGISHPADGTMSPPIDGPVADEKQDEDE